MAKITRFNLDTFGRAATNIGQIGSARAGTKLLTTDPATIQALSAYANGLSDVTLTAKRLIPIEEMNALHFLETKMLAYLQQEGIPEYSASTTYFQYSIVKKSGTYQIYGSKTDDNTGNALTDTANWQYLVDLSGVSSMPVGSIVYHGASSVPSGFLIANGSAVSRTTYASLFAVISTTYGSGDGSTTFNLPDLRGEFIRGYDSGRGVDSGRVFASSQTDAFQGHAHTTPLNINFGNTGIPSLEDGSAYSAANFTTGSIVSDGTNGTPRVGQETRPRNIAMLPCIKY